MHTKANKRTMSTLVVADSPATDLRPVLTAAKAVGKPISVLTVGEGYDNAAIAKFGGVAKVLTVNNATAAQSPEIMAEVVKQVHQKNNFTHIFAPSSIKSKDFVPRFAAQLNVQSINDITKVISEDTFQRNTYAGNAITTVKSNDAVKIATVRASAFAADKAEQDAAAVEVVDCTVENINAAKFVKADIVQSN
eukprot:UN04197